MNRKIRSNTDSEYDDDDDSDEANDLSPNSFEKIDSVAKRTPRTPFEI